MPLVRTKEGLVLIGDEHEVKPVTCFIAWCCIYQNPLVLISRVSGTIRIRATDFDLA